MKISVNNSMIIRVTDMDLKDAFLAKAAREGLTISNDRDTKTGIEHITIGCAISVGTSDKFHINWARNIDYYAKRGIVPVYDISLDWNKIIDRFNAYVKEVGKSEMTLESNASVVIDKDDESVEINSIYVTKDVLKAIETILDSGLDIDINTACDEVSIANDDGDCDVTASEVYDMINKLDE